MPVGPAGFRCRLTQPPIPVVFIYRSFLILLVAGITWFSYLKHVEARDRKTRVQDLAECFQRREFASTQPPPAVQTHFWQALAYLDEAQRAERSLGWWRKKDISVNWYLNEALKGLEATDGEASLISRALENAYFEVQRHGVLVSQEGRDQLKQGQPPDTTVGLFSGDPLVIGFLVSPVLVPQLRNHPGNFVLQSATVFALQQDVPDSSTLNLARQFYSAGLVPTPVIEEMTRKLAPPRDPEPEEKND